MCDFGKFFMPLGFLVAGLLLLEAKAFAFSNRLQHQFEESFNQPGFASQRPSEACWSESWAAGGNDLALNCLPNMSNALRIDSLVAQVSVPQPNGTLPVPNGPQLDGTSPSRDALPGEEPVILPAPEELLGPEFAPPVVEDQPLPGTDIPLSVDRFEVTGSTAFSQDRLQAAIQEALGDIALPATITFQDILAARDAVTQLYLENQYLTSGAIVPLQEITDGVVEIRVEEGSVESIDIVAEGDRQRLRPGYIRRRVDLGAGTPLNITRLLDQLQMLRQDPLIDRISAQLQAGSRPGTNQLVVFVTEAETLDLIYSIDNNRSPSVGSVRNQARLIKRNLTGAGDTLTVGYSLTSGSEDIDFGYTYPINPLGGTVSFDFSTTNSDVVEEPFDVLAISSDALVTEVTLRQPLIRTPTQELALGLVGSRQRTQTFLGIADIGGFPLSSGAENDGRTAVTALRFFQEWTQRSPEQVVALRSQFNFGIGALNATANAGSTPDSLFFSWLGQGQWVRAMGSNKLMVLRGSLQLTPDPLLSLERYSLGGRATVRGYEQDELLTDNGANLSLEFRLPVWEGLNSGGLLQVTPFIEGGYGWNTIEDDPDPNGLLSIGTGLWLQLDRLNFRADWGIPLISVGGEQDSLQENGVYFSLEYSFL